MVRPPTGGFCAQMASEPTREELVQRIRGLIAGWRVEANDNMNDMRAQCAFDDCADALERLL